jgi:hypothetical protein
MTKTASPVRKTAGKKVSQLQAMEIDKTEGPDLDLAKMTPEERELFMEVTKACVACIHSNNPIQQAANMEIFFASSCRTSLFFAGLHVRELRKLKEEFSS